MANGATDANATSAWLAPIACPVVMLQEKLLVRAFPNTSLTAEVMVAVYVALGSRCLVGMKVAVLSAYTTVPEIRVVPCTTVNDVWLIDSWSISRKKYTESFLLSMTSTARLAGIDRFTVDSAEIVGVGVVAAGRGKEPGALPTVEGPQATRLPIEVEATSQSRLIRFVVGDMSLLHFQGVLGCRRATECPYLSLARGGWPRADRLWSLGEIYSTW